MRYQVSMDVFFAEKRFSAARFGTGRGRSPFMHEFDVCGQTQFAIKSPIAMRAIVGIFTRVVENVGS